MKGFKVRYGTINPSDIRGRLIRNPNYGGQKVELNGWCWTPVLSKHTKPRFQEALNASIKQDGIRNPILVWALPEGLFLTFGGSRVKAALHVGLSRIPAIINDYTGEFHDCPEVTPKNVDTFFTDPPRDREFNKDGFDYHYNLERARRANHDAMGFAWLDDEDDFIAAEFPWLIGTD
jgi:hypothetical protein